MSDLFLFLGVGVRGGGGRGAVFSVLGFMCINN